MEITVIVMMLYHTGFSAMNVLLIYMSKTVSEIDSVTPASPEVCLLPDYYCYSRESLFLLTVYLM